MELVQLVDQVVEVLLILEMEEQEIHLLLVHLKVIMVEMEHYTTLLVVAEAEAVVLLL